MTITFDQKRDAACLFMRAHARLNDQAADKVLVATSMKEIHAISDYIIREAAKLKVENFYYE